MSVGRDGASLPRYLCRLLRLRGVEAGGRRRAEAAGLGGRWAIRLGFLQLLHLLQLLHEFYLFLGQGRVIWLGRLLVLHRGLVGHGAVHLGSSCGLRVALDATEDGTTWRLLELPGDGQPSLLLGRDFSGVCLHGTRSCIFLEGVPLVGRLVGRRRNHLVQLLSTYLEVLLRFCCSEHVSVVLDAQLARTLLYA